MRRLFSIFLMLLLLAGVHSAFAQTKRTPTKKRAASPPAAPPRLKIAEGKYELRRSNGPVDRTFEEVWTLYRTKLGYAVEEQWHVGAGQGMPPNVLDVSLEFISGLHPLRIRIGSDEERSLHCALELKECRCKSMGTESALPMSGIYDFFLPSPWMLGSIARRSAKDPGKPTQVQLVRMAGMSPEGPKLHAFPAQVQYVGDDLIEINGKKLASSIYELKAPDAIPEMLIWVAPDGIVLALQDSTKQEQRMELTQFTRHAKL